jgi:hypothetical protein
MKLTRLEIHYGGNIDEREKNGQIMRESSYITEYDKIMWVATPFGDEYFDLGRAEYKKYYLR